MSAGREIKNRKPDKRGDHRHTLALDTEVYFSEQSVAGMFRCRTQNIGLHGAFLPSNTMPIDAKTDIELVFSAQSRARNARSRNTGTIHKQYRLQAQVVHTSENGAGLVFSKLDHTQTQDFRRFLFRAKVAARN